MAGMPVHTRRKLTPRAVVTNRRKPVQLHQATAQWMGYLLEAEGRRGGPGPNEQLQAAS